MAFTVVYDACTLYPAPLRDLLMRLAQSGIVRARWSERILDECFRSIASERPDLPPKALQRTRALMCAAVADCLVTGYEEIERAIELPDADDRHVVAAAIRCGAQAIVTYNLKDFPDQALAPFGIEAKHPDEFVLDAIGISAGTVVSAVTAQADALRNPPMTIDAVLEILAARGLEQSTARLRRELGSTR
jgi:hypothetical protein